ncbi:MAG: hypothetical protein M0O94_04265 [Bacteroidales bacterium]|nr:hypothetical protein [Bacteroidales bacterium]MDD2322285.1 hypothetical protein [Bacteroidales bacterium]MDY0286341.1 hypothetical protein [Bacteroidales bacterium]
MKKNTLLMLLYWLFSIVCYGQQDELTYPHGKAEATIHTDFFAGSDNGSYKTAFEVKRAYLGYESQLSPRFYTRVTLDIGSPNDQSQYALLRRYAYFKYAYLEYKWKRLTVNFGIIPIYHFNIQEKTWGHRYIYKSVNDEHGLGFTADLGTSVRYEITSALSVDVSLTNGEGYTRLQSDDRYKAGAGFTGKWQNGIRFRIYGDLSSDEVVQTNLSVFLGCSYFRKGLLGAEFNRNYNDDYRPNYQRTAISAYTSWDFNPLWQIFARYDHIYGSLAEGQTIPYSLAYDGTALIFGVQYSPLKHIKMAVNYQDWFPWAANAGNKQFVYLNLEIKI